MTVETQEVVDQGNVSEQVDQVQNADVGNNETTDEIKLSGDGDWSNPQNYSKDPEVFAKQMADTVKRQTKLVNEKLREAQANKSKYSFNSLSELKDMFDKNPELQNEYYSMNEMNENAQNANLDPSQYMDYMVNNWDALPQVNKNEYFQNLSPEQKLVLQNAITLKNQEKMSKQEAFNRNESANIEKYGDRYKELANNTLNYFNENFHKNARELVFRSMNYESYGKEQFELGKQEAIKELRGATPVGNLSSNNSVQGGILSPAEALDQALKKHGLNDIGALL